MSKQNRKLGFYSVCSYPHLSIDQVHSMQNKYVTITARARQHLRSLIEQHPRNDVAIRIYVENPATPEASCCMAFCKKDSPVEGDKAFQYDDLLIYLDKASTPFLKYAQLDCIDSDGKEALQFYAPGALPHDAEEDALMKTFLENYRRGLVKR